MPSVHSPVDKFERLREQAEEMVRQQPQSGAQSGDDLLELLHELKVHQTELEIQNEELKRAQQELTDIQREFENLYEFAPCGYVTLSPNGIITRANLTAVKLLGSERRYLVNSPLCSAIAPGWENVLLTALRNSEQNGILHRIEFPLRRTMDPPLWVRADVETVRDDNGGVRKWRMVLTDISQRKQAEEEKERMHNQLLQAHKMESVGRLAGGVAHELNNMLLCILGYGEMLLADKNLPADHKRRVELIYQAGECSRDLVRQLLAFSRKQPLKMEYVDINHLLSEFRNLLQKTVQENIEVQCHLGADVPRMQVDWNQLQQIVLNLVVNAQDAMPDGGLLSIETRVVDLDQKYASSHVGVVPGRYVALIITDTGHGMDQKTQKYIFDPFFTTKEMGQKTGLGLATVYGIVKQHQGNIWVYSEPGQGTTFKIYLPVQDPPGTEAWVQIQDTDRDIRGNETVLVVEDDDMVRELTVNVLQKQGYTVLWAPDGSSCLELLRDHSGPIDLLLTDVIMPDMNGRALHEQVVQRYPDVKVLYMSGYTKNVISHHGVLDNDVNFLQKPFSMHDLYIKIREVLEGG